MTEIIKSLKLIRITKYFCPPRNDRVATKLFHKTFYTWTYIEERCTFVCALSKNSHFQPFPWNNSIS